MHEIRIRVSSPLHRAATFAAARRSIPAASLVSLALYEYLHQRGELDAPLPATDNNVAPKPTPSFDMSAWLDDDEDDD
jgi:hypothetical protein